MAKFLEKNAENLLDLAVFCREKRKNEGTNAEKKQKQDGICEKIVKNKAVIAEK